MIQCQTSIWINKLISFINKARCSPWICNSRALVYSTTGPPCLLISLLSSSFQYIFLLPGSYQLNLCTLFIIFKDFHEFITMFFSRERLTKFTYLILSLVILLHQGFPLNFTSHSTRQNSGFSFISCVTFSLSLFLSVFLYLSIYLYFYYSI